MPTQDPLSQLRDIHLPDAISAWPPAPGWWLLAALLLAVSISAGYWLRQHRSRNRYRRLALQQLKVLCHSTDNPAQTLQALNQLLKQTVLAARPPADVAGLSGEHWLQFLDHSASTTEFSQGVGKVLLDGPYTPNLAAVDVPALLQLARLWIKRHRFDRSEQPPC